MAHNVSFCIPHLDPIIVHPLKCISLQKMHDPHAVPPQQALVKRDVFGAV
jgi:hypothetical protein